MPTTYSESHRKYYQEHKQEIAVKRKTADRTYYERHKEDIRRKNLERYYAKKAAAATPQPNVPDVIYLEIAPDVPAASPAVVSV